MFTNVIPEQLKEYGIVSVQTELDERRENRSCYSYRVEFESGAVFEGNEYSPSPFYDTGADNLSECGVADLVWWMTLDPDECDIERNYTPEQMQFIKSVDAQMLNCVAGEMSE